MRLIVIRWVPEARQTARTVNCEVRPLTDYAEHLDGFNLLTRLSAGPWRYVEFSSCIFCLDSRRSVPGP